MDFANGKGIRMEMLLICLLDNNRQENFVFVYKKTPQGTFNVRHSFHYAKPLTEILDTVYLPISPISIFYIKKFYTCI